MVDYSLWVRKKSVFSWYLSLKLIRYCAIVGFAGRLTVIIDSWNPPHGRASVVSCDRLLSVVWGKNECDLWRDHCNPLLSPSDEMMIAVCIPAITTWRTRITASYLEYIHNQSRAPWQLFYLIIYIASGVVSYQTPITCRILCRLALNTDSLFKLRRAYFSAHRYTHISHIYS